MSDFSLSAYDDKPEDPKKKLKGDFSTDQDTFILTKSSHRDPEKHQKGDTLPDSLLDYQEGSSSLTPDPAGNSPKLLRSCVEVAGVGGLIDFTNAYVVMAGMSTVVTVPTGVLDPFVIVSYGSTMVLQAGGGAGAGVIYGAVYLRINGVVDLATQIYKARDTASGAWQDAQTLTKTRKITLSAGTSYTIDLVRISNVNAGTSILKASAFEDANNTRMLTELYY